MVEKTSASTIQAPRLTQARSGDGPCLRAASSSLVMMCMRISVPNVDVDVFDCVLGLGNEDREALTPTADDCNKPRDRCDSLGKSHCHVGRKSDTLLSWSVQMVPSRSHGNETPCRGCLLPSSTDSLSRGFSPT